MKRMFFSLVALAAAIVWSPSALMAEVDCYRYNNRTVVQNCLRRQAREWQIRSQKYDDRANRIQRFHEGVGGAMQFFPPTRPLAPAWNVPRNLNSGYQWYRRR